MSRKFIQKITCPKCGQEGDFTVWSSINTMLDPEMKEKVKTREAFNFHCVACGNNTNVNYDCLYHQMEDEMMIYYASSPEETEKVYNMFRGENKVSEVLGKIQNKYLYRIVHSQNELREKIFIFDAGLDDRVIEIIKLMFTGKYQNNHPEVELDDIFFQPGKKNGLVFLSNGKPVASCEIENELYDMIFAEYVAKRPELRDDDIIINLNWALQCLREM